MPTYEYKCSECNHILETIHSIHEEPLLRCPACSKSSLKRMIGVVYFNPNTPGFHGKHT